MLLDAAKNLKIVVRAGAGYDNIDLSAATVHNVVVMNTPGQNSNAVAELALGLFVDVTEQCAASICSRTIEKIPVWLYFFS